MVCPFCGNTHSRVTNSHPRNGGIYRRRVCGLCNKVFTTYETATSDDFPEVERGGNRRGVVPDVRHPWRGTDGIMASAGTKQANDDEQSGGEGQQQQQKVSNHNPAYTSTQVVDVSTCKNCNRGFGPDRPRDWYNTDFCAECGRKALITTFSGD